MPLLFTRNYNRPENSAIWWRASPVPKLNNKLKTTSFVSRLIHEPSKFAWAVLGSVRTTKRDTTGPPCDHVHWRFGYQFTWTLSKADTSLKRTVALVPRVSALERVECIHIHIRIHIHFDVTSVGQRSSPWPCYNLVKVEVRFPLECKLRFPCAQFRLLVLIFLTKSWRVTNCSFCTETAESISRWPIRSIADVMSQPLN